MSFDLNQTENELIEEMGNVDGGLINVTLNELAQIAGLGNDEKVTHPHLRENFPKAYAKGRYAAKAVSELAIGLQIYLLSQAGTDICKLNLFHLILYESYQWWNFDVVNIPEALDIIGQDVKPVNVAVLDTGSPFSVDPAFTRSIFDTQWGWDMVDNDALADDDEFPNGSFSHCTHVGSTISMLNDGLDGNGMAARVTPIRVCAGGCPGSATYGAYFILNGDANDSLTTYAQRSAGQKSSFCEHELWW